MIFETERLIVREWQDTDAADAYEIYSRPEVNKGIMGTEPASVEEMGQRLKVIQGRYADLNGLGAWPVEVKKSRKVIGTCLLKPLPNSEKIEVGWHVGMEHWGNSYAPEFGAGALKHGFETVALKTVYAILIEWNQASRRVCEKLRMQYQVKTSEFHDRELELYAITAEQFAEFGLP